MTDIQPYSSGMSWGRRRYGRDVTRYSTSTDLRRAAVESTVDLAIAKINGYTSASAAASNSICRVARAQTNLELLCPEAAGRLNFLSEVHAMAMGELLSDLVHQLRRP